MAKKPDPGRCVHCLQFHDELTWDHVFPESWYPDTTPEDLEKWKIPACLPCNKDYGRIEEDLLIKLGLCIDPKNHRGAGIAFKAVRALRSDYGKNDKDANLRRQNEKINRENCSWDYVHWKQQIYRESVSYRFLCLQFRRSALCSRKCLFWTMGGFRTSSRFGRTSCSIRRRQNVGNILN